MQLLTKIPNSAKYIVVFLGGIFVGSIGTNYILQKKYLNKLDDEIEKTRQYFLNAQKEGVIFEEKPSEPKESINQYKSSADDVEFVEYNTFYKVKQLEDPAESEHPTDDEEELSNNYTEGKRMTDESDRFGIEVISNESYDIDFPQFEKLELTYWALDGILSDDEENMIDDLNRVVGGTIFDTGLVELPEVETIFIRNYNLGCDYRIHKVYSSYKENVIN